MKNTYIFLFFTLSFLSCTKTKTEPQAISVKINLLKESSKKDSVYSYYDKNTFEYFDDKQYDIEIEIWNNSDSVANIVLMTCSWDENILINTPDIIDTREDCNSNYPYMQEIDPHDKFVLIANLKKGNIRECTSCPGYNKMVSLRMGLIIIQSFSDYEIIMNDRSLWQIIWSNPLELEK